MHDGSTTLTPGRFSWVFFTQLRALQTLVDKKASWAKRTYYGMAPDIRADDAPEYEGIKEEDGDEEEEEWHGIDSL